MGYFNGILAHWDLRTNRNLTVLGEKVTTILAHWDLRTNRN